MSFANLNLNPRPCRDDDHDIRATRWRHPTRRRICASIYRSEGHRRRGGGGKVQKARYSGPAMYRSKTRLPGSGRRRAPPPVSVPWFAQIDKVRVTYVTSGPVFVIEFRQGSKPPGARVCQNINTVEDGSRTCPHFSAALYYPSRATTTRPRPTHKLTQRCPP